MVDHFEEEEKSENIRKQGRDARLHSASRRRVFKARAGLRSTA